MPESQPVAAIALTGDRTSPYLHCRKSFSSLCQFGRRRWLAFAPLPADPGTAWILRSLVYCSTRAGSSAYAASAVASAWPRAVAVLST